MKTTIKKGQKVVCPFLGNEKATVMDIYGDKADIKYTNSRYWVSVSLYDLQPSGIDKPLKTISQ